MAISRTLACSNSRQWLLKSFISTYNIPSIATPQRRKFTAPPRRWNEAHESIQQVDKDAFALDDFNEETSNPFKDESNGLSEEKEGEEESDEAEHIPWYLRGSPPLPSTAPDTLSARQQIPDLPDHPPPLLTPLLQQISVDLGIDDLTLLDLRSLDPPPALGSNLLMLIGTARSDKHLHVSADKLCRWLRSEHRLSPFADGLLGRQELKLKLRRKAKRSKLMSAVGGKGGGDAEDLAEGIRTGWVCINVGLVKGAEGESQEIGEQVMERKEQFVGFGPGRRSGVRIVVQMLTEEKREEVDLEKLWNGVLKKSNKEKEAIANQEAVEEELVVEAVVEDVKPVKIAAETVLVDVEPAINDDGEPQRPARIRGRRGRQQIRRQQYHTSARQLQETPAALHQVNVTWDEIAQSARSSVPDTSSQPRNNGHQSSTMQTNKDDAEEFYKTFVSFPALRVPRSAGLYTILFKHIASGAFNSHSTGRISLRDNGKILDVSTDELRGLPADLESQDIARETLRAIRSSAEAKAMLSDALCAMESEDPTISPEAEGGVELAIAVLKAVRVVDPEGGQDDLKAWSERCERVLRKALDRGKAAS